jgi:hypothetical protein
MTSNMNINDGSCCSPSFQGFRKLTLPDGAQVGIIGLDAVMEELYAEGKAANESTALEMIQRLGKKNYFSPSSHKIYADLFTVEYKSFYAKKAALIKKENNTMANQDSNQNEKKKGLLANLFKGDKKEKSNSGGCCNMKIVPIEKSESKAETEADAKNKGTKGGGCCGGGSCCS